MAFLLSRRRNNNRNSRTPTTKSVLTPETKKNTTTTYLTEATRNTSHPTPPTTNPASPRTTKQKKSDGESKCLLWLLWFSTAVGGVLVTLALASSFVLITFPVEDRYDGPFLDLSNPRVVALINAAWGLLFTIMLLFVQQLLLSTLLRRVTKASRMSHATAEHFEFLLRLRITFGAITMVVLLLGVMCVFIERAVIRGGLVLSGAWTVCCWYWATAKTASPPPSPTVQHKYSLPTHNKSQDTATTSDNERARHNNEKDKSVVVLV